MLEEEMWPLSLSPCVAPFDLISSAVPHFLSGAGTWSGRRSVI